MLTKDTTQEERYKAVKFGWETTQPGRSTKARDSREAYLKSQASTSARNSDISLNIPDLDVLNYPEWRAKKMEAYQEFQKSMNERFNGGLLTVKKSREFQLNTYQQINQENFDISRKIGEERASYRKFLKDASDGLSLAPAISVRQQPAVDQPVVVTTEPKQPEDDLLAAPTDNTKNNKKKPAKK
jgi:hypothetical protein